MTDSTARAKAIDPGAWSLNGTSQRRSQAIAKARQEAEPTFSAAEEHEAMRLHIIEGLTMTGALRAVLDARNPKQTTMPKRGDYVCYRIPGRAGQPGTPSNGYVLGMMDYGDGFSTDVALIGDERAHGCPVNAVHLTVISSGHDVSAWVDRYAKLYPNAGLLG